MNVYKPLLKELCHGISQIFFLTVQKLVVGNLTHEKHYLLTSKGRYDLN